MARALTKVFAAGICLLIATPCPVVADQPAGPKVFFSGHLNSKLIIGAGIFPPSEAEEYVLPFMEAHPELFKDKQVLDIGTGTGIIALYAAKLGAKKVIATDVNQDALNNAATNIKKMGYKDIVETRLVGKHRSTAFTALKPDEIMDTIISNPPYIIDEDAPFASPMVEKGNLGLSIIDGLKYRLAPDGHAVLLYRTFFSQKTMASLAMEQGYDVRMHDSDRIMAREINIIYDFYLQEFLKRHGRTAALNFKLPSLELPKPANLVPLIDGDDPMTYYPGLIVIRHNKEKAS